MSARKRPYKARRFESVGERFPDQNGKMRPDTFANIYESMLLSQAYQSLNDRQARLYVICKAQYFGKRKPSQEYKQDGLFDGEEYFFLNWATVSKYGIYKLTMSSNFYKDMQALQDHGFIKRVASGKAHKQKTVYSFSSDWQSWKPP